MCSPTTHLDSFRCNLHKNTTSNNHHTDSYPSNRLNMRRPVIKNSLVRIGGVEGEWVKRALTALIRPSSHQQRRRERPSSPGSAVRSPFYCYCGGLPTPSALIYCYSWISTKRLGGSGESSPASFDFVVWSKRLMNCQLGHFPIDL
ncbi:uncharacterized protein HKW66_Vig0051650 [Vigna angularis]|uniref:Uncharacterized protein n=1 Tax=Phaseolus angularis TaxID=3914 RepID=A0A8T0KZT3_PHAAN|nr:uncharacterized protein HKW66_Vig0051650 [Vigna angularis]